MTIATVPPEEVIDRRAPVGSRAVGSMRPGVQATLTAAIGLAAAVIYAATPGGWAEVWYQVVAFGSIAAFAVGLRRHRSVNLPWLMIGAGFFLFAIGDTLFSVNEYLLEVDTFPSTADVAYLLGYPVLAVGMAALVRREHHAKGRGALIDAGIFITPLVVAGWIFIIDPLANDAGLTVLERAVSAAYPIGDLLCLAVLVRLLAGLGVRESYGQPALGILIAGLASMLAADTIFMSITLAGTYVSGGITDGMYLVSYVALAATALSPSVAEIGREQPPREVSLGTGRLTLLAVAALITPAMLALQWVRDAPLTVPLVLVGTVVSFLLVVARMSGLVQALEASRRRLEHEATHDVLTGLPNRQLFRSSLEALLRAGAPGALLFADLDRFKAINDNLGHHAGDEVLVEVAHLLETAVRRTDLVARLAGDEFVVLIESGDRTEVLMIAQRLVDALRVSRHQDGHDLVVTASVGLVTWPRNTAAAEAEHLMKSADRAMYDAKTSKGDQLVIAGV